MKAENVMRTLRRMRREIFSGRAICRFKSGLTLPARLRVERTCRRRQKPNALLQDAWHVEMMFHAILGFAQ